MIGLCACGEQNQTEHTRSIDDTDSLQAVQDESVRKGSQQLPDTALFRQAFNQFFHALQTADTTLLNQFIHPEQGVWLIEQPGAMPKMTHVRDLRNFKREYQDRSFFTVAKEMQVCRLKQEPFPTFDCGDMDYEKGQSGYSKEGCFAWKPDKFQKSGYWDYASLSPDQLQHIHALLPHLQRSVLHTDTSFEFHFGYLDGSWYLLFAKLIYPCSA
ncbi:hypothetical protein ACXYMU_03090 [Pontibacter sp. CAU 1760]